MRLYCLVEAGQGTSETGNVNRIESKSPYGAAWIFFTLSIPG